MARPLLRHGAHTEAGRRPSNQDAVTVESFPDGRVLLALADGMGGHRAGEQASACALAKLVEELRAGASLEDAFRAANRAVYDAAQENPEWEGMGTTLIGLLVEDGGYQIANVGDSRAYHVVKRTVTRLTADHSVLEEARRTGPEAVREVEGTRWRHALTRAVGTEPEVEVDRFGPFPVEEAHTVLLCSDGLYQVVSEEALAEDLETSAADLDASARGLVERAFENGSTDNISVVLGAFDPAGVPVSSRVEGSTDSGPRARNSETPRAAVTTPASAETVAAPLLGFDDSARSRRRGRRSRLRSWLRQYDTALAVAIFMVVSGLLLWFL